MAAKQRLSGVLFAMAAALMWSSAGVAIKRLPLSAPAIAGYRSLFALPILGLALAWSTPSGSLLALSRTALRQPLVWAGAAAYALCVTLFVLATKLTTAANAILFQYSAPIYVALLSWPLLGERVRGIDWLAVLGCLCGMAWCFSERLSATGWTGNVLALMSGLGFGLLPLIWRRLLQSGGEIEQVRSDAGRHLLQLPLILGNALTALLALPWMVAKEGLPTSGLLWLGLWVLGSLQIGVAYLLYAAAVRRLRAVESLLAATLEPILNPIWVALWAHEIPGRATLIGGSIILGTVLVHGIVVSRSGSPSP